MGSMSKLLNKPFKAFTIYALIILAGSIPVYFIVVDYIWKSELDEHNLIVKESIQYSFNETQIAEEELNKLITNWNLLQLGTNLKLTNLTAEKEDSLYTTNRRINNVEDSDFARLRGLSSYISYQDKVYHIQIETNIEESDETMWAIGLVTLFFFSVLVIGFIFLNKRIAKAIWQPFRNTLETLKTFDLASGNSINFNQSDIEEFQELNQSLQKLIDENVSTYAHQKTFIENASHELQTPLAVLKSKIELLLQSENLNDTQAGLMAQLELPLSRISRINKNLLLLAKIENKQFHAMDHIELTTAIQENLELLEDYIASKKIQLHHQFNNEIKLHCNKTLLEMLLNNLLINAITHNNKNGELFINFSDRTLSISNSGTTALKKDKLFKRFSISSTEHTNSGLGLAIVKEICHRYSWQIEYRYQDGLHCFSIEF
jgi:signal transduction histidine kinase